MTNTSILKVAFVGSGAINFGGAEGPWDHSERLERIGSVQFVGIVDPLVDKARQVLQAKINASHGNMYSECQVYATAEEMLKEKQPDAVLVGTPPNTRGSMHPEKALELFFLKNGIHTFIEKPLSSLPPEDLEPYVRSVTETASAARLITSVGYMFR